MRVVFWLVLFLVDYFLCCGDVELLVFTFMPLALLTLDDCASAFRVPFLVAGNVARGRRGT